jgi:hypothetical protein
LKCRYLKWARIAHLDIWNISYDQKKGRESNCQFDSQPLKVRNHPDFLAFRWHATYIGKALDESYNFALDCTSIRGLVAKLWGSKVVGLLTLAVLGFPLGSPRTKSHLDVGLVERHIVYYKGEGGGFPQVRAVVSLVCPCCPWLVLTPRVLQLCTNHFVWVVCMPVWVSEACQLFLVPSRSSNTPLYPSKCCELRSMPRLLLLSMFPTWTRIKSFKELGARQHVYYKVLTQSFDGGIKCECYQNSISKNAFNKSRPTWSFKRWLDVDLKEDTFDHATMLGWSSN